MGEMENARRYSARCFHSDPSKYSKQRKEKRRLPAEECRNDRRGETNMQKQKKVLIAEENGDFLKSLLSSLRNGGFECVTVPKNGESVLSAIEKFNPDVVVMEAFLARLDALGVLR